MANLFGAFPAWQLVAMTSLY